MTEYKPTHGTVFSDYLTPYSHWSYTDIDMLIGDLPLHISSDELSNFDIFTYHFGDVFRLYLRGQFACHLNSPKVNLLWAQCPHLGSGLVKELETKLQIVRRLAAAGQAWADTIHLSRGMLLTRSRVATASIASQVCFKGLC